MEIKIRHNGKCNKGFLRFYNIMKLFYLSVFTQFFSRVRPSFVPTKKICRDCIHFIGDNIECRKFGDTNIITGKITYNSARSARENEKLCGKDAILFERNHFKIITVPFYFVREKLVILLPVGLLSLYFYEAIHILNK